MLSSFYLFYSTSLSLIFVSVCVLPDVTGYYAPPSSPSTSDAMESSAPKPAEQMTQRKAALDLTRFAIQAKGPYGKWTRKPLAYLRVTCPEISLNPVF